MAGPFRIEGKALTIAAKSKPAETGSPLVAAVEEPVKPTYGAIIVIAGVIALAAAGVVVYTKKIKT